MNNSFAPRNLVDEVAERFGLSIEHSSKVGNYVRTLRDITAGEQHHYSVELACVAIPGTKLTSICAKCYMALPQRPVPCQMCPQEYCNEQCRDSDLIHALVCTGRSCEAGRFHEAVQKLESHVSYTLIYIHLAVKIWLLTFAYFPKTPSEPLDYLQPEPFFDFFFKSDPMQEFVALLANVYDALLTTCFPASPPPAWATFSAFARLCSVAKCNSFELALNENDESGAPTGCGLFPFHCMLAHSCAPNCGWSFAVIPERPPLCSTTPLRDIKSGESLTISYIGIDPDALEGVLGRRAFLCSVRRFVCCCDRCEAEAAELRPSLLARDHFDFPTLVLEIEPEKLAQGIQTVLLTMNRSVPEAWQLLQMKRDALAQKLVAVLINHVCIGADQPAADGTPSA